MPFPEKIKKIIRCEKCNTPLVKRVDFSRFEVRKNLWGQSCTMPIMTPETNGASLMVECPKCAHGLTFCFAAETIKVSDGCVTFGED